MKEYHYSTKGKIKITTINVVALLIVAIIFWRFYRVDYIKYFVWLGFLVIIYFLGGNILNAWTTSYVADSWGLSIKAPRSIVVSYRWSEVDRIIVDAAGSRIKELRIYFKGIKHALVLDRDIEGSAKLFANILDYREKYG